jgi:hypothetical protein
MRIGLQRSKTAREMIKVMTDLVARYGYATSGESFSISMPTKLDHGNDREGTYEKGGCVGCPPHPDGYVSGHANQPG